jgi:hypothetical protein
MLTKFIALCPSWETDKNYPFTLPQGSLSCSQVPAIGPYLEAEESILHRSPSEFYHHITYHIIYHIISHHISYNLFSFHGFVQDYKIHMDMEIVKFA